MLPSTMKAWRFHTATGGAEKHMVLEQIALPTSSASLPKDSTLVKVLFVSLNPVDIKMASTRFVGGFIHPVPAVPGLDGVGRVVETTDPTRHVGQLVAIRVKELQREGALAEYVVVPRHGCAAVPENVSPIQAATVGTCGVTAYQALASLGPTEQRQSPPRVFIYGGSGGTGTFEIQIAKALGCYVATSCSTPNVELCKKLGADEVFDYRQGSVEEKLSQLVQSNPALAFDLVVDNLDQPWRRYKAADDYLDAKGTYVQIGGDVSLQSAKELLHVMFWPTRFGGGKRRVMFLRMRASREDAERVLGWMSEGRVRTPIDEEFAFGEVPRAYERLMTGRARGKIVVRVCDE